MSSSSFFFSVSSSGGFSSTSNTSPPSFFLPQANANKQTHSFKPELFDSFYPDEQGQVEARKRLMIRARCYIHEGSLGTGSIQERDRLLSFWMKTMLSDSETAYYVKLIGGEKYLHHLGMWVARRAFLNTI